MAIQRGVTFVRNQTAGEPTIRIANNVPGTDEDAGIGLDSSGNLFFKDGGDQTVLGALGTYDYSVPQLIQLGTFAISASTTSGQIGAYLAPQSLVCDEILLYVDTQSTGACTLDIGTATNATTSADNLMDGISVASASVNAFTSLGNPGTNGTRVRQWGSTANTYITVTVASGDADGFVGRIYAQVKRLP